MDGCYYTSIAGQVFGWTQILPTLITSALSILSFVNSEIIFVFLGLYLHVVQLLLWVFQVYFEQMRVDPICQQYQTYAFPSIPSFYAAALITSVTVYAYYWKVVHGWLTWLRLYIILSLRFVFVWVSYNRPSEVLFSMTIGVKFTTVWVIVLRLFIAPTLPYLLNSFPCSLFGYTDRFIMKECEQTDYVSCKAALNTIVLTTCNYKYK